jgi:hypothetical protein
MSLMPCSSPANCMSFFKTFFAWNGITWAPAPPVRPGLACSCLRCHAEAPRAWLSAT